MEAKQLAPATLDDLIFEGRNKTYGAYQLRQEYNDRMSKAAGISFSSVLLLLGLGYAAIQMKSDMVEPLLPPDLGKEIVLQTEVILEKVVPPKAAAAPAAPVQPAVATERYVETNIVPDHLAPMEEMPDQAAFTEADPGLVTAAGTPSDGSIPLSVPGEGQGTSLGDGAAAGIEQPFDFVEQMPDYADGGQAGMLRFISKHLRYPNRAQSEGVEGTVIVSFVVSASGEVTQVTILKDLGAGTGEEALRVISKMSRWKPGVQNHRHVPVRMTLPIRFKLG
jgi:periplasmic protein TonB